MKTLLCPTDFSPGADAISRYAARLAHDVNAKVVLTSMHSKKSKALAGEWDEEQGETADRLGELHDLLKSDFQIPCETRQEAFSGDIHTGLSAIAGKYDLTILGVTEGKEDSTKYSLGVDLIKVIQKMNGPLLIVPEKFEYKKITRILFAFDYNHEPQLTVLSNLSDWFGAEVRFLSILQDNIPTKDEENLIKIENKIANQWTGEKEISFESIPFDNVTECLEHYLNLWSPNDLMVLSVNPENALGKLWHKSVVKQLLLHANHPYLIIHQ